MKKTSKSLFWVIAMLGIAFLNFPSRVLTSEEGIMMTIESLALVAVAQSENYTEAAKAVEEPIMETRTQTYFSFTCNCMVTHSYNVEIGTRFCCQPATVNDRCSASC